MDASRIIERFAATYTVTRRVKAGYDTHGVAQAMTTSTLSIVAAIVPAEGDDLQRLPEGRRSVETRAVYTTTQLLIGDENAANEADLISLDGVMWEVEHADYWSNLGATFCHALIQRAT